jgi:hypothetical protein
MGNPPLDAAALYRERERQEGRKAERQRGREAERQKGRKAERQKGAIAVSSIAQIEYCHREQAGRIGGWLS